MEISRATPANVDEFAAVVSELFWSTGAATYEYQLGSRAVMDAIVGASWPTPGTLFGYDAATLATDRGELLGIELGFADAQFVVRRHALGSLWPPLIESGKVGADQIAGLGRRSAQCSWLNPDVPNDVYYIHAIAVAERHRGRGVGAALLRSALDRAHAAGLKGLQLDVLSDNPAVDFYRSFGLETLVESTAPIPFAAGVPTEFRMGVRFPSTRVART